MDTIEPFENVEDITLPTATFGPDGVSLQELREGAQLNIDRSSFPMSDEQYEEDKGFSKEDMWQYINTECIDPPEDSDMTPFLHMEKTMIDLTSTGGVFKKILRTGVGPVIPEGATVRVHYNGYLEYSDEPYDSSRLRNKPLTIRLGQGEVIEGLEMGVASMRKSELTRLLIKPEYAFGKMGCPPRIPPDATILFEVEVLSFVNYKAAEEYNTLSDGQKDKSNIQDLIDIANAEREAGNDFFEQKIYGKAAHSYNKAINLLEGTRLKDEEEEKLWSSCLLKLYLNLALCDLRQRKPKLAITHSKRALELDEYNVKATFRLGQAYSQINEWEKSKLYFLKAAKLSPNNTEIRQEIAQLDRKIKQFQVIERGIYSRMFQNSTESSKNQTSIISESLHETRFKEKLIAFQTNFEMRELVFPLGTSDEELQCIEKIAEELGMETQRGDKRPAAYSLRITKPDMPIFED